MLLWGGIGYITAGGDKEATQNASKRISAALIGLAIAFYICYNQISRFRIRNYHY